jgi:hypothetical protein
MDPIGVKTEILRLNQVEWQNCKYQKTYFSFTKTKYVFNRSKRTRVITFWIAGSKLEKGRDSLAKVTTEPVSMNNIRPIQNGRSISKQGRRERAAGGASAGFGLR